MTQAEALVLAAEHRLGRRPWRRTDLLTQRLAQRAPELTQRQQLVTTATQQLTAAQAQLTVVQAQVAMGQTALQQLELDYATRQRPERPHSHLAQVRRQTDRAVQRLARQQAVVTRAQAWLMQQQQRLTAWETETATLTARLAQLTAENAANPNPLLITLRLDAGFGTASNLAWLIEMGYEIYTKPYGTWLAGQLRRAATDNWQPVGKNAAMVAWPAVPVAECPYPVDLGYTRYWHGETDGQAHWTYSG